MRRRPKQPGCPRIWLCEQARSSRLNATLNDALTKGASAVADLEKKGGELERTRQRLSEMEASAAARAAASRRIQSEVRRASEASTSGRSRAAGGDLAIGRRCRAVERRCRGRARVAARPGKQSRRESRAPSSQGPETRRERRLRQAAPIAADGARALNAVRKHVATFFLFDDTADDAPARASRHQATAEEPGMAEALEDAVEAKDKRVALIIAILALFLALVGGGRQERPASFDRDRTSKPPTSTISIRRKKSAPAWSRRHRPDGNQPPGRRPIRKSRRRWTSRSPPGRPTIAHYETDKQGRHGGAARSAPRRPPKGANSPTIGSNIMNTPAA